MPQPITGKIRVTVDPIHLAARPALASHIAIIGNIWAVVEDELALIFAFAVKTDAATATAVFGRVNNLNARLEMIQDVIKLRFSEAAFRDFSKPLRKRIRNGGSERVRIIHAHWSVDKDYPDYLIRSPGLGDPHPTLELFNSKDFQQIEDRLVGLYLALQDFRLRLSREKPRTARQAGVWRLRTQTLDREAIIRQAIRKSRPAKKT